MTHDPLCGLSKPCDDEIPEHGYCSMQHGVFCIHCHQWCICEELAQKYAAALRDAVEAVTATYALSWCGDRFNQCDDYEHACQERKQTVAAIESLASTPDVIESDKEQRHHD